MQGMKSVKQLIEAYKNTAPVFEIKEGAPFLSISEFFIDTIQGENFVGWPSAFMRLQHCTLNCVYCDSREVWRTGRKYGFPEIHRLLNKVDSSNRSLIDKFKEGQHLVLTGGSPLKQQKELILFLDEFKAKYGFLPYIEVENECTIIPATKLIEYVSCWNNSPKLASSLNPREVRYRPEIILMLSNLKNSWFKFVIGNKGDWKEIENDFLKQGLVERSQIVLMPMGQTREQLEKTKELTVELAIENNVRYTSREHIVLWDMKTGV